MSRTFVQAGAQNALEDPGEIARFYDCCSDLMRELLDALSEYPDQPRAFPVIEDAIVWPRRRIASVLGGVSRLRWREFEGRALRRIRLGALRPIDVCIRVKLGGEFGIRLRRRF